MILVDQPRWPNGAGRFAHLASDVSLDELHAFAARLGPMRFHDDHYDLPAARWYEAVAAGATVVSAREIVVRLRAAGLRPRRSRPARGPAA